MKKEPEGIYLIDNVYYYEEPKKLKYLKQIIGFLLHSYRERGRTDFFPVLVDDLEGGSGKGTIIQAIDKLINICTVDAQNPKRMDASPKQLNRNTKVKFYNDMHKYFDLKEVRNEITDNGEIKHLFKDREILSYEDTWKTAGTSNFPPQSSEKADLRRLRVFLMSRFFNINNTLIGYYKHSFWGDYKPDDWTYFYNVMFSCVQEWLKTGFTLSYEDTDYQSNKIESSYSEEFRKFIVDYLPKTDKTECYETGDLFNKYKEEYSDNTKRLTSHKFGRDLVSYLNDAGYKYYKSSNKTKLFIQPKNNN